MDSKCAAGLTNTEEWLFHDTQVKQCLKLNTFVPVYENRHREHGYLNITSSKELIECDLGLAAADV
jgi:hypothetical protein